MKKYLRSLILDALLAVFLLWGLASPQSAVLSVLRRASPVWLFLTTGYEMRGKVFR